MPGLEQKICAWMQEALEQDKDVATCMRKVLLLVKAAGLGEALLDAYGDRLIALVWREFRDDDDEDDDDVDDVDKKVANGGAGASVNAVAVNGVSEASSDRLQIATVADNHAAARAEPAPAPRGVRWMDVEQLATEAALLECLYQVDAKWIRLGDLNKRQCRVLQRQHGAAADAFGQLAAGLADGQIVRQRWTADQLEDLVGDTLRAAAPARPIST